MKKSPIFLLLFVLLTNSILFAQTTCQTYTGTVDNIRSINATGYCFAVSTDRGTGNWYKDASDMSSADNTGTVLVDRFGDRWKRVYTGAIHVSWWGSNNSDTTSVGIAANDTAIRHCINYAQPYQTIYFDPGTYKFNPKSITTTNLTITGSKANLIGILEVGNTVKTIYNSTITGLTFSNQNGHSINLKNCRNLRITDNVFNNCSKAIYVEQYANATVDATTHSTSLIEMKGNYFNNVGYCFYADRSTNANATWQTVSDCTFEENVTAFCDTTAVYCQGIDGLKYLNNTIITPTDTARRVRKQHHLYVSDISDWVIVNGNNFFESGQESILVTGCKDLTVSGNNFAWSGQSGVYSVIREAGTIIPVYVNVTGNIINGFSGNVVQIDTTTDGNIDVSGNNINYSNLFTDYFGGTDLSTIQHYVVYAPRQANRITEKNFFNKIVNLTSMHVKGLNTKFDTWGTFGADATVTDSLTTHGSAADTLAGVYDAVLNTSTFGGTLLITAKNAISSTARTSNYLLMINQATSSTPDVVTVISQAGLTSGTTASDPSFTFTVSGNRLYATPVGSTSGKFYFYIKSEGDLVVTDK